MTSPDEASGPRLLGKGERGDTQVTREGTVLKRPRDAAAGQRAWLAGALPLWSAVRHEGLLAPVKGGEEGWVRPYAPGPSLAARGAMEWADACRASVPVLDGLDELHAAGLIHGHVCPSNLFLHNESLVLADGGWSTRMTAVLGRTLPGTLGYLSPEVLLGRGVEPRSDLHALGACLFLAVTGRTPWDAPTQEELFRYHLRGKFRRLRSLAADAPAELERLLAAMLAPTLADRPRSAAEAAVVLARLAGVARRDVHAWRSFPVTAPLVGRVNEMRALRLALIDTCVPREEQKGAPLLLAGPRRIERNERPDSVEGLTGERSVAANSLSVSQPIRAVVVTEEGRPEQSAELEPMNGGVLLIAGEEGTGKTRLVEELEAFALGEGVELVVGRCPQRPMRPLDPFCEVLETILAREPWEGPREALPPLARYAELTTLSNGFEELEDQREADLDAVSRFLVDRARRSPLAICVEDLHYADGSVCALFLRLVRTLRTALHEGGAASGRPEARADLPRLLLLATYDPTAGAPRAEDFLRELRDIDAVQVLTTLPLPTEEQVRLALGFVPDEGRVREVVRQYETWTAGKPLWLTEVMHRWVTTVEGFAAPNDLWEYRTLGLNRGENGPLSLPAGFARAVDAAEVPAGQCVGLTRLRHLRETLTPSGPRFEMMHDWDQRMAWRDCGDAGRKAVHQRCRASMQGGTQVERDWHAMKAGDAAMETCRSGMQCLMVGDWELAETLLEAFRQARGKQLSSAQARCLAIAQVLSGYDYLARSLLAEPQFAGAETSRLLERISSRKETPHAPPASEAERACAESEALMWDGRPDKAAEAVLRALRTARESGPSRALPGIFLQMGRLYRFAAQFGPAIHCFRRAARMLRDGKAPREEYARAVSLLAEALRAVGSRESADKAVEEAAKAAPERKTEGPDAALSALRLAESRLPEGGPEAMRVLSGIAAVPRLLQPRVDRLRAACALAGEDAGDISKLLRTLDDSLAGRAEHAGDIEEAWLAHHAVAGWIGARWDASSHLRRAAELVMAAYEALPEELKKGFLEDPVRKAIIEA